MNALEFNSHLHRNQTARASLPICSTTPKKQKKKANITSMSLPNHFFRIT